MSFLVFSLGSLWQDFEHLKNWWTYPNKGLPLCRYKGCKFKFYRAPDVDYVVIISTCYPMIVNPLSHANMQPYRALMGKNAIIVPSKKTMPNKKAYITKHIPPPQQMVNRWYFQKELCNTPLVMLQTVACSLDHMYLGPQATSSSTSFYSLNTKIFSNKGFQELGTTGYSPKNNYYLYATRNGTKTPKPSELIYLGNTMRNQPGEEIGQRTDTQQYNETKWGNPFWHEYLHRDKQVFLSDKNLLYWQQQISSSKDQPITSGITYMENDIITKCRYNPLDDTGEGNVIFLNRNTRTEEGFKEPADTNLVISGLPIWCAMWGWVDWQKKLHVAQQIDYNYMVVFNTDKVDPKLPYYVPINETFFEGKAVWDPPDTSPSPSDNQHWYPKHLFQQEAIDNICMSGPATPKPNTKSINANMYYKFKFLWGGCPAAMENLTDPCSQPQYPTPGHFLSTTAFDNPITSPTKYLYCFDQRRDLLTEQAAKRIRKDSQTVPTLFTDGTNSLTDAPIQQKTLQTILKEIEETSSEEEEEAPLLQQLQHQRQQQRLLKHKLLKLIKITQNLE